MQALFVPSVETKLLPVYAMKKDEPPKGLLRGERLKWARERYQRERGERVSGRAFALAHGIKVPTLDTHEKDGKVGGRSFDEDEAERYARILSVDFQWLHKGKARARQTTYVKVVGLVGLGDAIQWSEVGDMSLGEIELPFVVDDDCFGLEARGQSQYPRVQDGEVVVARWLDDVPASYVGREVVLKTDEDVYLLKTLKRHEGDNHFTIGSHNAPDVENVHIVRVAEIMTIVPAKQWKRIA